MLIAVQTESVSNTTKHWLQWCNWGDTRLSYLELILFIIICTRLRVFIVHSHISMVKGWPTLHGGGRGHGCQFMYVHHWLSSMIFSKNPWSYHSTNLHQTSCKSIIQLFNIWTAGNLSNYQITCTNNAFCWKFSKAPDKISTNWHNTALKSRSAFLVAINVINILKE